jgi:hypothetical protein
LGKAEEMTLGSSVSIEDFRRILGYNPWHFWGITDTDKLAVSSACNDVVRKYAWQAADACGRDDIEEAISTAEFKLAEYLGYDVAPVYHNDLLPWPKFYDAGMGRIVNVDGTWRRIAVRLPRGRIQKVGLQRRTEIDDTVAVTLSDEDGDGIKDTFTLSVATSVTDAEEIALYFSATERWDGSAVGEQWRVKPVRVTISGGVVTIVGKIWTIVKPELHEGAGWDPLVMADSLFPTNLGVYRLWMDPNGTVNEESQGVLIWETAVHGWWCCCSSCTPTLTVPASSAYDPAAEGRAVARVGIRDSYLGLAAPGEALYDAATGIWNEVSFDVCPEPDRVRIRYLAGYPLVSGNVDPEYQRMVVRMAAAELTRPVCSCEKANRELYSWQFDLARAKGLGDEQYSVSLDDLDNPFGTRRGHVSVWKEVNRLATGRGIAV